MRLCKAWYVFLGGVSMGFRVNLMLHNYALLRYKKDALGWFFILIRIWRESCEVCCKTIWNMVEAMGIEPMSVGSQAKSTTCLFSEYTNLLPWEQSIARKSFYYTSALQKREYYADRLKVLLYQDRWSKSVFTASWGKQCSKHSEERYQHCHTNSF